MSRADLDPPASPSQLWTPEAVDAVVTCARGCKWGLVADALQHGFPVNAVHSEDGYTVLHYAAGLAMDPLGDGQVWGHAPTAALALAHGASPTHREPHMGSTPMLWAACRGNVDILRALIDAGGDVNQGDFHGMYTPLIAVARGKVLTGAVDRARVLLAEPGLDPLATRGGKTAEEWARERGMDDVADAIAGEVRGAVCAAQPTQCTKQSPRMGFVLFGGGLLLFVPASCLSPHTAAAYSDPPTLPPHHDNWELCKSVASTV
jgi:ankyrin repeat protein